MPSPSNDPDECPWLPDTDWMATARTVQGFSLDAVLATPDYVPGWLLPEGTRDSPLLPPLTIADPHGYIRTEDAIGHERELAAHYRAILHAAPGWEKRRASRRGCFDVDIVIGIAAEDEVRIEMFNGAALGAAELLAVMADPHAAAGVLYDNLDQGWALYMVATEEAVFSLEWDWECPPGEDARRALRFPRRELAAQAASARDRLAHLHGVLKQDLGVDVWNQPASAPPPRFSSSVRLRVELVLLIAIAFLSLLRGCADVTIQSPGP